MSDDFITHADLVRRTMAYDGGCEEGKLDYLRDMGIPNPMSFMPQPRRVELEVKVIHVSRGTTAPLIGWVTKFARQFGLRNRQNIREGGEYALWQFDVEDEMKFRQIVCALGRKIPVDASRGSAFVVKTVSIVRDSEE